METRRNAAANNLRQTKNENNENLQEAKQRSHVGKPKAKSLQRNKRVPLGTLSNSFHPFQTRSKLASSHERCQKNDISALDKHSHTKMCGGTSQQTFAVYIDQENIPWPSVDMIVHTTNTDINEEEIDGNNECIEEESISDMTCNSCSDDDTFNDSSLLEYVSEIYEYLKEAEKRHRPKRNFMNGQPLINKSMRAILVDWLVEVSEEYSLVPETLFLTVNYIDRFLSSNAIIDPSKLQLVGVSCMLIASKLEEIYPPEISEFVFITNSTYTGDEVRQMENVILKSLAFDLAVPTVLSFLERYGKSVDLPHRLMEKFSHLTKYYCEVVLQDADLQWTHLPSLIAASCVALALNTLECTSWFPLLATNTGYQLGDMKLCIKDIHEILTQVEDTNLQAIKDKYSEF
ncbi:G2 mitotic-specific cyclin-A-like, partial [Paramuricea clavata]